MSSYNINELECSSVFMSHEALMSIQTLNDLVHLYFQLQDLRGDVSLSNHVFFVQLWRHQHLLQNADSARILEIGSQLQPLMQYAGNKMEGMHLFWAQQEPWWLKDFAGIDKTLQIS